MSGKNIIGKDTALFISVSARPGSLGASVYNALFAAHAINAVYLPRVAPESGEALTQALRTLGIQGCSVSMPLKEEVVPHLDELSRDARQLGSVNTIVQREGKLFGYNTDWQGAAFALEGFAKQHPNARVLVYGAGGVTPAVITALRSVGITDISITARRTEAAGARAQALGLTLFTLMKVDPNTPDLMRTSEEQFDLLVNATPSEPDEQLQQLIGRARTLFDLLPSLKDSPAISFARTAGLEIIPGLEMFIGQVCVQAELYTGIRPTPEEVREILRLAAS